VIAPGWNVNVTAPFRQFAVTLMIIAAHPASGAPVESILTSVGAICVNTGVGAVGAGAKVGGITPGEENSTATPLELIGHVECICTALKFPGPLAAIMELDLRT
jgi:hypothetical protein